MTCLTVLVAVGISLEREDEPCTVAPLGVLAFSSVRGGNRDIYIMRAGGTCPQRVTANPGEDIYPTRRPLKPADALASAEDRA